MEPDDLCHERPAALDLKSATLAAAADLIRSRRLTATELTSKVLGRLHATEPLLHAYAHVDQQAALERAAAVDRDIAERGPCGPLHGIPVGIKDLFATRDMPTEAGSSLLRGYRPSQDADLVRALRERGAIFLGKQATHEFGLGMNQPATRTPWGLDHYPGGSTVGGAVATAVGSCLAAFGTDGGGSIRKPAAINGLVGLKPTFGRFSTQGIVPGGTSVDHVGWITRSVQDSALIYAELAGQAVQCRRGVDGLRLGCVSYFFTDLDSGIENQVRGCLRLLERAGAEIVRLDLPELEAASQAHAAIAMVESYRLHEQWVKERPGLYHPASLRCLLAGASITETGLQRAYETRERVTAAFNELFSAHRIDALCSPTVGLPPVPLSELDPEHMLGRYTRLTAPFNLSGHPAISVPCGIDRQGFPIGFQIAGPLQAEAVVLSVAASVERLQLWSPGALCGRLRSLGL